MATSDAQLVVQVIANIANYKTAMSEVRNIGRSVATSISGVGTRAARTVRREVESAAPITFPIRAPSEAMIARSVSQMDREINRQLASSKAVVSGAASASSLSAESSAANASAEASLGAASSAKSLNQALQELAAESPAAAAALNESALTQAQMADAAIATASAVGTEAEAITAASGEVVAANDAQSVSAGSVGAAVTAESSAVSEANAQMAKSSEAAASEIASSGRGTIASTQELADSFKAAGLSAEQAYAQMRQAGISASEATYAVRDAFTSEASAAEEASLATKQLAASEEEAGASSAYADRMTGYFSGRLLGYAANVGPLGYALGMIGRVSDAVAPVLAAMFPIAVAGIFVDMVYKGVDALTKFQEKTEQADAAMIRLTLQTGEEAQSIELQNLKIQDQIDKLSDVPSPNALEEALIADERAADGLINKLGSVLIQTQKTLNFGMWDKMKLSMGNAINEIEGFFMPSVAKANALTELFSETQLKMTQSQLAAQARTVTQAEALQQEDAALIHLQFAMKAYMEQHKASGEELLRQNIAYETILRAISAVNAQEDQLSAAHKLAVLQTAHPQLKESAAEANRRWLLSHAAATGVHANLAVSAKAQSAGLRKAQSVIQEYNRSVTRTASDEQLLADAIKQRVSAMGAAGTAALATIVPATSPTAPTSGVSFGVGTVSDQLAAAEAVQEHLRALQEARVISYQEMIRQLEALDAELYSQRLISEQEYNRRIQTLEDQQLVHNVRLKTAGQEAGAGLSRALMEGMTTRQPNSMSIALYNWFARSWDNAVASLMTAGLTNVFTVLLGRMSRSSQTGPFAGIAKAGPFGEIFASLAGHISPHGGGLLSLLASPRTSATGPLGNLAATPPFLPALTAQSKLAGTQSAMEFHNSFSSTLAGLPLSRGVSTIFSGITGLVASGSKAALAQQKATDVASKQSSASTAGANVYKSVSAIPVIGPFMAPAMAAAAIAQVLAFEKGGLVPQTSMALVHKNEMVLPADLASHIKNSMRTPGQSSTAFPGGAGAVHLHYTASVQALDTEGVGDILSKHGEEVAAVLERYLRSKNRA